MQTMTDQSPTGTQDYVLDESQERLEAETRLQSSPLFNTDLAPTKTMERTWTTGNVAALWISMAICVPTYTMGGVLTAFFGLSVTEALFTPPTTEQN